MCRIYLHIILIKVCLKVFPRNFSALLDNLNISELHRFKITDSGHLYTLQGGNSSIGNKID